MKKIYLSLAGLILCGSVISQNAFNMLDHSFEKAVMSPKSKAFPSTQNTSRAAGAFKYWVEPIGDIMTNKGLDLTSSNPDQDLFVSIVYQDSTVRISSPTSTRFVDDILLGNILDPKSTLLRANNDPICTKNDPYTIDSIEILGSYVKKTSATDTLYVWLVWGDTSNTSVFNIRLDASTWVAPIGNWRHSVIGAKITGGGTAAAGNKVKAAAPAGNKVLIKRVLTNSDSVGSSGYIKYLDVVLPTAASIPAGNIVSCFYTFVPGGTYVNGDCAYAFSGSTVPQNINGFCGAIWAQNKPTVTQLSDYQDHQVDATSWCMSASYDRKARHKPTSTVSGFMLGDLLSAPVIAYSVSGTSTQGVSELEKNGFALGQNMPNPFSNLTKINYQIKKAAENVTLQVFDIRGVKMFEKIQSGLQQGNYFVELNSSNYPAGIYFYSLTVDGNKITKKMIVNK